MADTHTPAAATASGFQIVEDHNEDQFYVILPDGTETEWCGNDEIAMADGGDRTYFATNCDDYSGMQAGVVYALGGAMPTTVVDYDDMPDAEEDEEEEEEVDLDPDAAEEEEEEEDEADEVEGETHS